MTLSSIDNTQHKENSMRRTPFPLFRTALLVFAIALSTGLGASGALLADIEPGQHAYHGESSSSKFVEQVREATDVSTGASLALVCAAKGYRLPIVSSDAFSREKLDQMAAFGAELTLVQSENGRTTKKLILDMIETARRLSTEPHTYWTDQLNNRDSIAGYHPVGEEIWRQTGGQIDAFVHCVGTAASLSGVATML